MKSQTSRGKNVHLSKADQQRYLKQLREAAESGDVIAMGLMVIASKIEQSTDSQSSSQGSVREEIMRMMPTMERGQL